MISWASSRSRLEDSILRACVCVSSVWRKVERIFRREVCSRWRVWRLVDVSAGVGVLATSGVVGVELSWSS